MDHFRKWVEQICSRNCNISSAQFSDRLYCLSWFANWLFGTQNTLSQKQCYKWWRATCVVHKTLVNSQLHIAFNNGLLDSSAQGKYPPQGIRGKPCDTRNIMSLSFTAVLSSLPHVCSNHPFSRWHWGLTVNLILFFSLLELGHKYNIDLMSSGFKWLISNIQRF